MIDTNRAQRVLRTNQAAIPTSPFTRRRRAATRSSESSAPTHQYSRETSPPEVRAEGRPNLLARVARAARIAVKEVRQSGDVPLPHLYWGRKLDRRRDAA